jgi:hypothetical protein
VVRERRGDGSNSNVSIANTPFGMLLLVSPSRFSRVGPMHREAIDIQLTAEERALILRYG